MSETEMLSASVDVTFVLPCLNEAVSLPWCLKSVRRAMAWLEVELGLRSEVIVADNGSVDGSRAIAYLCGARVIDIERPGYGSALRGGCYAAAGRFIVMGDSDGSYDFEESIMMIEQLLAGADLCMGNRFKGGIEPGAMPWKNRYIGNPALSGLLNLMFRTGAGDAHAGLRAFSKDAFERIVPTSDGMEFASEILIGAALHGLRIVEVPITLRCDLRQRKPHLRPWRDGLRHLLLMIKMRRMCLSAAVAA